MACVYNVKRRLPSNALERKQYRNAIGEGAHRPDFARQRISRPFTRFRRVALVMRDGRSLGLRWACVTRVISPWKPHMSRSMPIRKIDAFYSNLCLLRVCIYSSSRGLLVLRTRLEDTIWWRVHAKSISQYVVVAESIIVADVIVAVVI